jgi:diguanylate cyclase (GGDEF)-like protein
VTSVLGHCNSEGFKGVNDNLGHLEGDALLQKVAEVFRRNIRRSDTEPAYDVDIACRYGGDEFCIILPETEEDHALKAAERIRGAVAAECSSFLQQRHQNKIGPDKQQLLNLTLSVGIATYPVHSDNTEEVVKKADDALYQAKAKGKNQIMMAGKTKE